MGRSVDYLNRAVRVNYFEWPQYELEDGTTQPEEGDYVVEDIQDYFREQFPGFDKVEKWDGRETAIILEGYGLQVGLSEYCGLATLSVRVDEDVVDTEQDYQDCEDWLAKNWDELTKYWKQFAKIGTFSNGEGVYQRLTEES